VISSKQSKDVLNEYSKEYLENIQKYRINVKEARKIQRYISERIVEKEVNEINLVAGLDCSYYNKKIITSMIFYDIKKKEVVNSEYSINEVYFPYIPTLLFLREGPFMVSLIKKSKIKADVYFIDGHGKAHPFGAGLACYVGYLIDMPTVGIAKRKLFGKVFWKNGEGEIIYNDKKIGYVIKVCDREFYISVGNMITLHSAVEIFKKCIKGCDFIPLLKAHEFANLIRKNYKEYEVE